MKKLMLLTLVLALAAFAATNTFHVTFDSAAWIGATEVKAGEYKLTIEGDKVTLKGGKNVIDVPGKVEVAEHEYRSTAVVVLAVGNRNQLKEIEIGGTKTRIVVEQPTLPTGE
jgi:hypothetical protein